MSVKDVLFAAAGAAGDTLYVEDVFSTYLYTGNGSTQTITNGINLGGKGGLVWIKSRSAATGHFLFDTERGALYEINSNTGDASASLASSLTAFNSDGFSISSATGVGVDAATYASWTFRQAPKFFDVQTKSHTNGSASTVDLAVLETVGAVFVKRTDDTGDWWAWHRSLTAGNNLRLNTPDAESTTNAYLSVTGTTLTIASGMATGTYVVYAYAHDTTSDGVIQCGSFASGSNVDITLGWEPQWLLCRRLSGSNWFMFDTMRCMSYTALSDVSANSATAEGTTATGYVKPTATGWNDSFWGSGDTIAYIAIRRGPMRTPTSGTDVFNPTASSAGSGTAITTSFPVDLQIPGNRNGDAYYIVDRLRGINSPGLTANSPYISSTSAAAETAVGGLSSAWNNAGFAIPGTFASQPSIYWNFRRAPGFFDEVCYTGTGSATTVAHNLMVVPELMIVKNRSDATGRAWAVYAGDATDYLVLNTTAATADDNTYWNDTSPTATAFSVGTANSTNESGDTFVAYLFATCPGVSKVGSYTGNGSNQTIECGFAAGARFVLIKRTDSTGDWYVWDSARGIVASDDPHLSLNSTAAEVTNDDSVDATNAGFVANQLAATNVNVSSATYIFLAIA